MTVEFWLNAWKLSQPARLCALLGTLALATGCGGVPKTYYYTLQTPAAPAASAIKTNFTLGVERFRSPEMLRDDRVVYFISPTEMNYYEHHRWGSAPAVMLSDFTAQWLESTGVFAQVKMLPIRVPVDYLLSGKVLSFEEADVQGGPKVRLAFQLSLERVRDHKMVWSGQQRVESSVSKADVDSVAAGMSDACTQALRELIPGLVAQVADDYKNSGK